MNEFNKLCAELDDPKVFEELFDLFLTIEERRALALRWELTKALLKGKQTQREIAEDLHVSIAKITRGSNALKIASKRIKELIKNS